jgi:molecular chaperone DnaJ
MQLRHALSRAKFSKIKVNYFDILQIDSDASNLEIQRAFNKGTKLYHPDLNNGDNTKFMLIKEAYKTLMDAKKKRLHIQYKLSLQEIYDFEEGYFDVSRFDLFWEFKGGFDSNEYMFRQFQEFFRTNEEDLNHKFYYKHDNKKLQGQNISAEINLKFNEAINGCTKTINFESLLKCSSCRGNGKKTINKSSLHNDCEICLGNFKHNYKLHNLNIQLECNEHGYEKCSKCSGEGLILTKKDYKVKVPPGVSNKFIIEGMGGYSSLFSKRGDLEVYVNIEGHKNISRVEDDLVIFKEISPVKAYFGGEVMVSVLDKVLSVNLPSIEKWDEEMYYKKRVSGYGVYNSETKNQGDLEIVFKVVIPKSLSPKVNDLYLEFCDVKEKKDYKEPLTISKEDEYLQSLSNLWG